MKMNMKYITYFISLILFAGTRATLVAQTAPPCNPGTSMVTDAVCTYSGWNWESNDCKMWRAYVNTGSIVNMGSPFNNSGSTVIADIVNQDDFRKANGWELIRRDFGCNGSVGFPWFVLYNKFTGLLRVYVWVNNTQSENFTGMMITMSSPTNGQVRPAVTSHARDLMLAPNKYPAGANDGDDEMTTYVTDYPGPNNWVVGEFVPSFDPNINRALTTHSASSMLFKVYGIIKQDMKLKGSATAYTKAYGFSGKTTGTGSMTTDKGNGITQFVATGKKVAEFAKSAQPVVDKIKAAAQASLNSQTTRLNELKASGVATTRDANRVVAASDNAKFAESLGKVVGVIAKATPYLNVISSVVGLLWPSKKPSPNANAAPAFTPTVTTTTMELEGYIEAKLTVQTVQVQVPGTNHGTGNLPYYDCALGIFNIRNQPELEKVSYNRYAGYFLEELNDFGTVTYSKSETYLEGYDSYRVRNSIGVAYNQVAGLELISAKAAIYGKVSPLVGGSTPYPSYNLVEPHRYQRIRTNSQVVEEEYVNHMLADLETGRLEMAEVDASGYHTFRTPFVDIECFTNMTFNVRKNTKVWVRVQAILKEANASDDASPIFYVKDYAVDVFAGTAQNANYNQSSLFVLPAYSNHTVPATSMESDVTITNSTFNNGNILAASTLSAGTGVTVAGGTASSPVVFRAGTSVTLTPGFVVTPGSNFVARTERYGYQINCGPRAWTPYAAACSYNTSASRLAIENGPETVDKRGFDLYPNPTKGSVTLRVAPELLKGGSFTLHDMYGKGLGKLVPSQTAGQTLEFNLQHLPAGMYVIKLTTPSGTISKKVVLTK